MNNLFKPRRTKERIEKLTDFERKFLENYTVNSEIFYYQRYCFFFYKFKTSNLFYGFPISCTYKGKKIWIIICFKSLFGGLVICKWNELKIRWESFNYKKVDKS